MNDIIVIENPKKKHLKNLYLNDFNYFNKNNIKMQKQKKEYFQWLSKLKKVEKERNPMPKMLFSTSENFLADSEKELELTKKKIEAFNDLLKMANNVDFFGPEEENQNKEDFNEENKENLIEEKKDNLNEETKENAKIQMQNTDDNIFLTKTNECKKTPLSIEIENDTKNIKIVKANAIFSQDKVNAIKLNSKKYKTLDYFDKRPKTLLNLENMKQDVSPMSVYYIKEPDENKNSRNIEEKYLDFRKKMKYPNLYYSKIDNFASNFNTDLGKISHSYGKIKSRERFIPNPLLNEYFDMVPIYDMYKDIKSIENRYAKTKYKFRLLPLMYNKIRHLDALAERLYKMNHIKTGPEDFLNSNSYHSENINRKFRVFSENNSLRETKRAININKSNPKYYKTYMKDLERVNMRKTK